MPNLLSKYLCITLRVFFILITLSGVVACSFQETKPVSQSYTGRTYVVAKGDTLYSIALRYGLYYKDLAAFNDIDPPYNIFAGQRLRVDIKQVKSGYSAPASGHSIASDRSKKSTKIAVNPVNSPNFLSPPKWQWPTQGKVIAQFQGETGLNKGIDLGGKLGEPVLAAASGQVLYAGSGLSGYGKLLIIKHNETFLSAYAHNNELLVKEGDLVKAGQKIADMGSSGTDRVKLHFEIRSDGNPVDPLKYLPKR
jgi:lipoprotein NlpD